MKNQKAIRGIISREVKSILKEGNTIPDFVLSQIASDTSENVKRHIRRFINQSSSDPTKQRQMLAAANNMLDELEHDVKELLEDKLNSFNQNI
jgi:hypothetical protein